MTASHRFVIFCEGPQDRATAETLIARVLGELVDWLTASSLELRGLDDNSTYEPWRGIGRRADEEGIPRKLGFSQWGPDSHTAWKALKLAERRTADGVLLIRDSDDAESTRAHEIRLAVRAHRGAVQAAKPTAVGVAHTKREAWVLAALEHSSERAAERQRLGFDPVTQPELLTAKTDNHKTSAKPVLDTLLSGTAEKDHLERAPLATLVANGSKSGLAEFLCEIRCNLGPLFTHVQPTDWCTCASQT